MSDFYTNVDKVFHDWNYSTPKLLYGLVRTLRPKVIVEVGTYRGYAAAWMAKACQENNFGQVYAIDDFSLKQFTPHRDAAVAHLFDNLTRLGVRDFVTLIEGDSRFVHWPDKIDLAYVDGWHGYTTAKHDFARAAAFGAECICLDDAEQSVGPRMVVMEARASGEWDVVDILRDCGMAICIRRNRKGPVTFSQEDDATLGLDLQTVSKDEQLAHLKGCSEKNKVDYAPVLPYLHRGKE